MRCTNCSGPAPNWCGPANKSVFKCGCQKTDPDRVDLRRYVALGCDCCVPQPTTICGQAEIGGRHIYMDFSGITGQGIADAVEQIFLTVVNEYSATLWQCFASVGGTDYYDPCERPQFVSEFYRNGRIDYGILTYLFSKEFRIEAEQLAVQITNDINAALAGAGLQVTALYRF